MNKAFYFFSLLLFSLFTNNSQAAHWESLILESNDWYYFEGNSEPASNWYQSSFNASNWSLAPGSLGYSDNDDNTIINNVSSLYLRKSFTIVDINAIENLVLDADYDDGFIAYLNGVEIARSSNVSGTFPSYNAGTTIDREAQMYSGGSPEQFLIETSAMQQDSNTLAIHVLNVSSSSSDLSARFFLHAYIDSEEYHYQSTPDWFSEPTALKGSKLPIITINTNGQNIADEPKITAHMGIINNGEGQLNFLTDTFTDYDGYIGIEYRGQSSQYYFPKKSYGFETRDETGENLNVRLLDMPKENDWILYAPYSDKSLMRNVLSFEMAKSLDVYSSRTAYCQLYVNNQYEGIYVLMEKIKRDDSRVDIDKMEEVSGDDNSVTGGYIFKVDKIDGDFVYYQDGFTTYPDPTYPNAMDITYQYVYPDAEDLSVTQLNYLKNYITEAEQVLISDDFSNKETGYNKYFNTGSFVDFMLINEVSKEVDKYRYSTFFYKKKASKGNEIYAGPIWDYNLGYGNVDYWDYSLLTSGWVYTEVENVSWSIMFWWKKLMEDPYFASLAADRYHELRTYEWSNEQVTYLIDSLSQYIYDAQELNYQRWPILGTYVWPNKYWEKMGFDEEVESLKNWVLDRLEWMDNNLTGNSLNPEVLASNISSLELQLELNDVYFNHDVLKSKYFEVKADDGALEVDTVMYEGAQKARLYLKQVEDEMPATPVAIEVDDNILTAFNDVRSNDLSLTSSISENVFEDNVTFYYSENQIVLETVSPEFLGKTLKIYNIQGIMVKELKLNSITRNEIYAPLNNGVYFVRYSFASQNRVLKIVVD